MKFYISIGFLVFSLFISSLNSQKDQLWNYTCSFPVGLNSAVNHATIFETMLDSPVKQLIYAGHQMGEGNKASMQFLVVLIVTEKFTLYRSLDKGKQWSVVPLKGKNGKVQSILLSPNGKNVLFFGLEGDLWRSDDAGNTITQSNFPGLLRERNAKFHPAIGSDDAQSMRILGISEKDCRRSSSPEESCSNDLYESQDGGATWPAVPLRTRVRGADWLIAKDAPNTIVSFEQKDKTTPNWVYSADRTMELVLSKDYFQTSEVIARDIVGYYMKDQHMFTAKVLDRGEAVRPRYSFTLQAGFKLGATPFKEIKFPSNLFQTQFFIVDVSEGSTVIAVVATGNSSANWADLYVSNSMDSDFSLSLKHVPLSPSRGGMRSLDFARMAGVDGIMFANHWSSVGTDRSGTRAVSSISFDKGGTWSPIRGPKLGHGQENLQVAGPGEADDTNTFFYSHEHAPGILFATGNMGPHVFAADKEEACYISRDGGWNWKLVKEGSHTVELSHKGGIAVIAENGAQTNQFSVSFDQGNTWSDCAFSDKLVDVDKIKADPFLSEKSFILYGSYGAENGFVSFVDFSNVIERECKGVDKVGQATSDYEYWTPHDQIDPKDRSCLLGRVTRYVRRKADSLCYMPEDYEKVEVVKNCACTVENYECDYCFTKDEVDQTKCIRDMESEHCLEYEISPPMPCVGNWTNTQGYRKVPGDTCETVIETLQYEPVMVKCLSVSDLSSIPFIIVMISVAFLLLSIGLWLLAGFSQTWRAIVNKVVSDKYLPDIRDTVPTADYQQLGSTNFSPDEEDGDEAQLKDSISISGDDDDEFDPRG